MHTKWIVIALLSVVLIGCGQLLPASDPLAGTSWVLTDLDDKDLLPDYPIVLRFEGYRLSGNSGCNNYEGEYDAHDERIKVIALSQNALACGEEAAMDQEREYLDNLAVVFSFELEDRQLTLITRENRKLRFVPAEN
ncbi:MAG: META domain-containing protein [Chloroflexi bacterium]|nr:MAG: META domain-containing protein [Chloroflexota bacterium]MBL1195635.1 META domain-containing protein [Chloroflexota bacterium]NOH12923.1 META domain-containing protein [Chloroflexota bacterium]